MMSRACTRTDLGIAANSASAPRNTKTDTKIHFIDSIFKAYRAASLNSA